VALPVPAEVEAVFREFRTCEFSTLAADGTPITWPMLPFWRAETGQFMTTTSIGLPDKAFNIRRNPRVSLLFSDPTASSPPPLPSRARERLDWGISNRGSVKNRVSVGNLRPGETGGFQIVLDNRDHAAAHPLVGARRRLEHAELRRRGPCGLRSGDIYGGFRTRCLPV
jgi:hypothetical protein